jgi:putative sterol carrier protein
MSAESTRDYFERAVPELIKEKTSILAEIDAVYEFQITGDAGGTWTLRLKLEDAGVAEGPSDAPDCTIIMEDEFFIQMVNGDISPQLAFLNGQLKVTGNMGLALKLTNLFN